MKRVATITALDESKKIKIKFSVTAVRGEYSPVQFERLMEEFKEGIVDGIRPKFWVSTMKFGP